MRNWSGAGVVAVVLSLAVLVFVIAGGYLLALDPRELSPDETTLLSTVLGAVVGAVATYLGVSRDTHRDTHHHYADEEDTPMHETETPEPEQAPEAAPAPAPEPEPTYEPQDPGPPEDAPPESTEEELRAMSEDDTPKEE